MTHHHIDPEQTGERPSDRTAPAADWYRDAVVYQLHVRSFYDSDGDGTGDFDGLTSRLDYFTELGVDTLWLLPFFPSPLRDDGYDISDYRGVHPAYGDLASFKRFLDGAHERGLKVVIELVLNHTSDTHPWFQRARTAPRGSPHRAFYVWSDTPDRYSDARIIFRDFETSNWTWDPVAGQYYWHRFYSHQPDLNFENPAVRRAILATVRRWFRLGVDGIRLDAVPYLFEQEGTNGENLPATHAFLRQLRAHIDQRFTGKMLLAEANQWPEDAVQYFGRGDECHMAFHFPLMPRLFLGLQMEDRTPIVDIIEQTPDLPDGCQWALFLRNHDELTLEMVTDEERDYMYRRYARDPRMRINLGIRRRLAPLLQDDRRRIELLTALLFSLQGTPIIYYGDEIGMGDNVHLGDRDAMRTPMQWSADRNGGFSRCPPNDLFLPVISDPQHHYEALNVEAQRANTTSLWWWTRRLVRLRRRHRALARGQLTILDSDNPKVLSFVRHLPADERRPITDAGDADVLVVANLSRHPQQVRIAVDRWKGWHALEVFGQSPLADLDEHLCLMLGPHDFYWVRLDRAGGRASEAAPPPATTAAEHRATHPTRHVPLVPPLERGTTAAFEHALTEHLRHHQTRGAGARVAEVTVTDVISLRRNGVWLVIATVDFVDGEPRTIALPVMKQSRGSDGGVVIARTIDGDTIVDGSGIDASGIRPSGSDSSEAAVSARATVARLLVSMTIEGERRRGHHGVLVGERGHDSTPRLRRTGHSVRNLPGGTDNDVMIIDDVALLKRYQNIDTGIHPEAELLRHLDSVGFRHTPRLYGSVAYVGSSRAAPESVVALLTEFVAGADHLFAQVLRDTVETLEVAAATRSTVDVLEPLPLEQLCASELGETAHLLSLLGRRTAELHLALTTPTSARFSPEPFSRHAQRAMYQALRSRVHALGRHLHRTVALDDPTVTELRDRPGWEGRLLAVARELLALDGQPFASDRSRVHGDLHLEQVLVRADDLVFVDFEGSPRRTIGERAIKRSPLMDLATLLRSLDEIRHRAVQHVVESGVDDEPAAARTAADWLDWATSQLVDSYRTSITGTRLAPTDDLEFARLLDTCSFDVLLDEITLDLEQRHWHLRLPLAALDSLIERRDTRQTTAERHLP